MSITLAPRETPTIEEIDSELDRFNDALNILGYEAMYYNLAYGEGKIEVTINEGPTDTILAEFYTGTPGFLDDFRAYINDTIDSTSVPRSAMQKEMFK